MRKLATYLLSAALGAASLTVNAQQPPADPVAARNLFERNVQIANVQANINQKQVIQSMFDMDLIPVIYTNNTNTKRNEFILQQTKGNYLGTVELKNSNLKLAYNVSTLGGGNWKSVDGINVSSPDLNGIIKFFYSQESVDKSISLDFWKYTSWTLEGIVNGEEFVVTYKVDNRKTLEGHGHLGKKAITVSYEYEKDSDLFAKRRKTTIGDQTYITEFTSKNGAYLSYVVSKQ